MVFKKCPICSARCFKEIGEKMNLTDQTKWKVTHDESINAQKEFWRNAPNGSKSEYLRLWKIEKQNQWAYFQIEGKHGLIYPYSQSRLAVWFQSKRIAEKFKAEKGWVRLIEGDKEIIFLIPSDFLDKAAVAIKARKKRKISKAHQKCLEKGREMAKHCPNQPSNGDISMVNSLEHMKDGKRYI